MPKTATKANDIETIREDLQSLKSNIRTLSKHIESDGHSTLEDMTDKARQRYSELKERADSNIAHLQDYSKDSLEKVEKEIKTNPGRSVALAFGAGVLASLLLRK